MSSAQQIDGDAPAFPVGVPGAGDNGWHGMSLRDWFAGQLLASGALVEQARQASESDLRALGFNTAGIRREAIVAALAYRYADAMLAVRKKLKPASGAAD